MMRLTRATAILGMTVVAGACNTAPPAEIDAANAAVAKAREQQSAEYASEAMKDAERAQAALESELQSQRQAWFPSYDRARELAANVQAAADRASTNAVAGRERADRIAVNRAAAAKKAAARAAAARAEAEKLPPVKVKDVAPAYPSIARAARMEGTVSIDATVGRDGKIIATNVVRSVPMLDQAALDAVKQWEYQPSRVAGKAVPAVVRVNVNFVRS